MSLARKHKARVQQKQAKSAIAVANLGLSDEVTANKAVASLPEALQKLKDGFEGDRKTLKLLSGDQQRDPFKKELIEKYRPLCEYFMKNYDDWGRLDCLFWWLIWRSDIEAFNDIEPELYQGVRHGLTTPIKGFERDWQTFYSDLVFLYSDDNLKVGHQWDPSCLLKLVAAIANGEVVTNGALKAKIYAVYGKTMMQLAQTKEAVKAFKLALTLNDKVGVKKLLNECEAQLESVASDSGEEDGTN